ncbi:MAG: heat-inducible transcriptional repressor HrcA [Elusimicrobiota bacterium]
MRIIKPEVAEKRKKEILSTIVYQYLQQGLPVSSDIIHNRYRSDISSALIRKIMAELENEGYLNHPHTSAGRIPTDKAYRWFVDSLMEIMTLAAIERKKIANEFKDRVSEINELFTKTSHLLASVSHYAGFIISPKPLKSKITNIEFIKIFDKKIMILIVTSSGAVKHMFMDYDGEVDENSLKYLSEVVNQNFCGKTLSEFRHRLLDTVEEIERRQSMFTEISREISVRLEKEVEEDLFLEGTSNIIPALEFSGISRLFSLLNFIEHKKSLMKALESDLDKLKGVQITLGGEKPISKLKEISLVRTTYKLGDSPVGVLGIIGPKRMEYPKMASLVNYISGIVNKTLESIYK